MLVRFYVYALLILGLLLPTLAFAQPSMADWQIKRSEKVVQTKGVESIEIKNIFGNVRTRSTANSDLSIFAVIQQHQQDKQEFEIKTSRGNNKLLVEVIYKEDASQSGIPDADKRRIDIALFVPAKTPLIIGTDDGLAEVKGHKAAVKVVTKTGNIYVKTKKMVEAQSASGNIHATFKQSTWKYASKLTTYSGEIRVVMPGDPNVLVDVETAGQITTDYSMQIIPTPGSSHKKALAKVGEGGQTLTVNSITGPVVLFRMVEMLDVKTASGQER